MKRTFIDAGQYELEDKVVSIKRVSKTNKGGRTMRFSALVVVGDRNGHVGVGVGKSAEIPEAIRNRDELCSLMQSVGLVPAPRRHEWWHYELPDGRTEKYPLIDFK